MNEFNQSQESKSKLFPHRPIDKQSDAYNIKIKNDHSLRLLALITFPIASAALLWWLSHTFVTLERYERERTDDKAMQREMRDDIKTILREVKK